MDTTRAYSGKVAAHFTGGPNATGVLTRRLQLMPGSLATDVLPEEATLWFAYRIENQDTGWGSSPQAPYDDWLTAAFRTTDGGLITSLLRTGNSADTATDGLPWDRYLYRMQAADLAPLLDQGTIDLVFEAYNDGDTAPTNFWLDAVRFCVAGKADSADTPTPTPTGTATPSPTPTPTGGWTSPTRRSYSNGYSSAVPRRTAGMRPTATMTGASTSPTAFTS